MLRRTLTAQDYRSRIGMVLTKKKEIFCTQCHVPSSHNVAATLKIAKRSKPRQTHQNSAGYCSQRKLTSEFVGVR